MRIFLYAARYDGQSIYPDIEYGMPKSAQRSNTDPYRSDPDAKRLQGREQLKALAHAARRDRAARSEEEQLLVARRRMARLRECVPTFWKTGGTVLLFLYPLVAASIFIFWTLHQKELAWTVLAGLAPGVPVLFFLRVWRIRRAIEKELVWAGGLPFPFVNYVEWISLERPWIRVVFLDPPEQELIADAIGSAVAGAKINWANSSELEVKIPPKYLYGSPDTRMEHGGDVAAIHAFFGVLCVVDRQYRVDRVECVEGGDSLGINS